MDDFPSSGAAGMGGARLSGPARVSGSAGTGKTIVAIHRAAHLARKHTDARVLLTTFSDTLANALQRMLEAIAEQRAPSWLNELMFIRSMRSAFGFIRHMQVLQQLQEARNCET